MEVLGTDYSPAARSDAPLLSDRRARTSGTTWRAGWRRWRLWCSWRSPHSSRTARGYGLASHLQGAISTRCCGRQASAVQARESTRRAASEQGGGHHLSGQRDLQCRTPAGGRSKSPPRVVRSSLLDGAAAAKQQRRRRPAGASAPRPSWACCAAAAQLSFRVVASSAMDAAPLHLQAGLRRLWWIWREPQQVATTRALLRGGGMPLQRGHRQIIVLHVGIC